MLNRTVVDIYSWKEVFYSWFAYYLLYLSQGTHGIGMASNFWRRQHTLSNISQRSGLFNNFHEMDPAFGFYFKQGIPPVQADGDLFQKPHDMTEDLINANERFRQTQEYPLQRKSNLPAGKAIQKFEVGSRRSEPTQMYNLQQHNNLAQNTTMVTHDISNILDQVESRLSVSFSDERNKPKSATSTNDTNSFDQSVSLLGHPPNRQFGKKKSSQPDIMKTLYVASNTDVQEHETIKERANCENRSAVLPFAKERELPPHNLQPSRGQQVSGVKRNLLTTKTTSFDDAGDKSTRITSLPHVGKNDDSDLALNKCDQVSASSLSNLIPLSPHKENQQNYIDNDVNKDKQGFHHSNSVEQSRYASQDPLYSGVNSNDSSITQIPKTFMNNQLNEKKQFSSFNENEVAVHETTKETVMRVPSEESDLQYNRFADDEKTTLAAEITNPLSLNEISVKSIPRDDQGSISNNNKECEQKLTCISISHSADNESHHDMNQQAVTSKIELKTEPLQKQTQQSAYERLKEVS